MLEKYDELVDKLKSLELLLSDPKIIGDRVKYQSYAREHSGLTQTFLRFEEYKKILADIEAASGLLKEQNQDSDLKIFLESELRELHEKKTSLEIRIRADLLPHDENVGRNVIVEIRAGAGGDEAAIFASDLCRMYHRFSENQNWKVDILSSNATGLKGLKEIIFSIEGADTYQRMRFESGVHRVQRVPLTEANGRIHTSTVTVAVLAEAEEIEIEIKPEELRIDVFRSSGPGGQSVNTTDSAVRVVHIPSGITVQCQDEKSQHKNKAKALRVLRARLKEIKDAEERSKLSSERKSQIGTGDRSEKIRTYNYSQNRVTDHRIGLSLYNLQEVMEGKLDPLVQALLDDYINTQLKNA